MYIYSESNLRYHCINNSDNSCELMTTATLLNVSCESDVMRCDEVST